MNFQVTISTCRVCMKTDQGQSLLENEDLQAKFVFTTRLTLNADDSMPNLICAKCIMRLRVAHEFIQLAHESEQNLKAFLAKISNDFQMVSKTITSPMGASLTAQAEVDELMLLVSENDPEHITKSNLQKTAILKKDSNVLQPNKDPIKQEMQKEEHVVEEVEDEDGEPAATFELYEDTIENDNKHDTGYREQHMHVKELYIQSDELSEEDCDSRVELEVYEESSQQNCEPQSELDQLGQSESYIREYEEILVDNDASNSVEEFNNEHAKELEVRENEEEELQLYEPTDDLIQAQQEETGNMHTEVLEEMESTVGNDTIKHDLPESTHMDVKPKVARKAAANRCRSSKPKKAASPSISTRFYCIKCNRDFSTKTNLTRHMATHEGSRPYQCNVCCKGFTQNGSLKQHMLTHTGEKPYVCKFCNRGFSQCKSLVFHMRRHTGDKPFHCDTCGMFFRQKDGLKAHILKHHIVVAQAGNLETHICIICKKSLVDKDAMQEHMRKHLNNYKNVTVLGALPSGSSNAGNIDHSPNIILDLMDDNELLGEKATFMSDELATCSHLMSDDISTHVVHIMATSTDEPSRAKKFQCRKCFKCFAIKKNLIRHLSIHDVSVSELFQCKTCEIAFDTGYALKVHRVREHKETGINLNECESCQMLFQNAAQLNDHNNSVHGLNCTQCPNLRLDSQKLLMEHMLEHELNEIDTNV